MDPGWPIDLDRPGALDQVCVTLLMTSNPPKRRVTFALEGERYVAVVTVKGTEGRVFPAVESR